MSERLRRACARSPTRCSTRAICSIRIARRPTRTGCAGSSACSRRARGARRPARDVVDAERVPGRGRTRTRGSAAARASSSPRRAGSRACAAARRSSRSTRLEVGGAPVPRAGTRRSCARCAFELAARGRGSRRRRGADRPRERRARRAAAGEPRCAGRALSCASRRRSRAASSRRWSAAPSRAPHWRVRVRCENDTPWSRARRAARRRAARVVRRACTCCSRWSTARSSRSRIRRDWAREAAAACENVALLARARGAPRAIARCCSRRRSSSRTTRRWRPRAPAISSTPPRSTRSSRCAR